MKTAMGQLSEIVPVSNLSEQVHLETRIVVLARAARMVESTPGDWNKEQRMALKAASKELWQLRGEAMRALLLLKARGR